MPRTVRTVDGDVVYDSATTAEGQNEAALHKALTDALGSLDDKAKWDALSAANKLEVARQVLRALARLGLHRLDQG